MQQTTHEWNIKVHTNSLCLMVHIHELWIALRCQSTQFQSSYRFFILVTYQDIKCDVLFMEMAFMGEDERGKGRERLVRSTTGLSLGRWVKWRIMPWGWDGMGGSQRGQTVSVRKPSLERMRGRGAGRERKRDTELTQFTLAWRLHIQLRCQLWENRDKKWDISETETCVMCNTEISHMSKSRRQIDTFQEFTKIIKRNAFNLMCLIERLNTNADRN